MWTEATCDALHLRGNSFAWQKSHCARISTGLDGVASRAGERSPRVAPSRSPERTPGTVASGAAPGISAMGLQVRGNRRAILAKEWVARRARLVQWRSHAATERPGQAAQREAQHAK